MALERPKSISGMHERLANAVPVVRVFPVAPIALDAFRQAIDDDPSLTYTFVVEVLLGVKPDEYSDVQTMVTPFGGAMQPGESVEQAAIRDLGEDTTMVNHSTTLTSDFFGMRSRAKPFLYTIPGEDIPRLTNCTVVPVRSSSFSFHSIRENVNRKDDKKIDILPVSPQMLFHALSTGKVDTEATSYPILEHLRIRDASYVADSKEQTIRHQAIRHVLKETWDLDTLWKTRILERVNHTRKFHNLFEQAHTPYAETLADCTKDELTVGFVSAQMRAALTDERLRDREGKEKPPRPADVLKMARYVSAVAPSQILDVLVNVPTTPAFEGVRVFRTSVRPVVEHMYGALMGEKPAQTENTHDLLRRVWPKVLAQPMQDRMGLFEQANEVFMTTLAEYMHQPVSLVKQAFTTAQTYSNFIADNMRSLGPHFQEHQPLNEITNAPMVTLLFLGLGFHPDVAVTDAALKTQGMELVRFEAFRTLVMSLTAIDAMKKKEQSTNRLFESGLNTFLQFPPTPELIDLGNGLIHQVLHRITAEPILGKHIHLLVDERPSKSPESIIRKMYQSPNVYDLHSINIALSNDNFAPGATIENHIDLSLQVRHAFVSHLKSQLAGSGWQVNILPSTHKIESLRRLASFLSLSVADKQRFVESLRNGIRPGSEGDLILREKFVISMKNETQEQLVEVNMYPFERVEGIPELAGSGFMGLQEKIADDATGRYTAYRWIARDKEQPCTPSLYELLYPPELYGWLMNRVKQHQHGRKKEH